MYKDNSLIPSEAVRLAALGLLAKRPRVYADLARDIRHFTARIVGPSLDLLGPSLELLKIEGLIEAVDLIFSWIDRSKQRSRLARCDPCLLKDIGIAAAHADAECRKHFWQQ